MKTRELGQADAQGAALNKVDFDRKQTLMLCHTGSVKWGENVDLGARCSWFEIPVLAGSSSVALAQALTTTCHLIWRTTIIPAFKGVERVVFITTVKKGLRVV